LITFYDFVVADDSLFTCQPMDFDVGLGFAAIAKPVLAAIAVLISGVVAPVWFMVHGMRRRREGRYEAVHSL
jgi:hypothetical protein